MLLGRERERQALTRLLSEARTGLSGVLALVGEPGIGKSALLGEARRLAGGFTIVQARGIESEAEVPFGGLLELLRPLLGRLDAVPAPQAAALNAALAVQPGPTGERFAVGAATLSLLAAAADDAPLLVLVDDAQWLDRSTGAALLFALRRLVADPIAVVLTARDGEPSLLDGADVATLQLAGLDRAAAASLVEATGGPQLAPELQERLYLATAGNPLALQQLAAHTDPLSAPTEAGPAPISASIAAAFARRSGSLAEPARQVLLLAATAETDELVVIERAARLLDLDVGHLRNAETAGLVALTGGTIVFAHPLARSAVYSEATADDRRRMHRALADALPDRDADRRAWHLAAAAVGPDEPTAEALAQAGARARGRSAYAVAASAFARAARLHPGEERRAALLYEAGDAAWHAGAVEQAESLLEQADALATEQGLVARIRHRRGQALAREGHILEAYDVLVGAAEQVAASDPGQAVLTLADAADAVFATGDGERMLRAAERAVELAGGQAEERTVAFAAIAHGMALVFTGDGAAGAQAFRRAVGILERLPELREDPEVAALSAMGPLYLREAGSGRALIDGAVDAVRARAAVGVLPRLLSRVGRDEAASDRWPAAQAHYTEAVALAREAGQLADLATSLACVACLDGRLGRVDTCRAHAAEALALSAELGLSIVEAWTRLALGELELVLGDTARAADQFEQQAATLAAASVADVDLSPAPELVDVYLRLGRDDEARAVGAVFAENAKKKGQPWALARSERALGLLEPADADTHFARALELHAATLDVFETARTQLAWGASLRRARRRVRARPQLRSALETFEALGAEPWAAAAAVELAATGETARRRAPHTLGDLTPQELQVALVLAAGKTTREAAAALFLSPKTVEYHLRHVYRKLGIASREELAQAMR